MNPKTGREAISLAVAVSKGVKNFSRKVDVVLAPPFSFVSLVASRSSLKLGAQDVFRIDQGAYTGEVSASQLKSLGTQFVIVGHSERRALGETNEMIHQKVLAVLKAGLRPILCVGEIERKKEEAFSPLVREELHTALHGIKKSLLRNVIIAYEPVWAISTNRAAHADNPKNVFEMTILIRRELYRMAGKKIATQIPILYGGSVDDKNATAFICEGKADGFLVGGASLHPRTFVGIVKSVASL